MKILKSIIASSIVATLALSASVQADGVMDINELMDIIHPESADLFHFDDSLKTSEHTGVFNLNDENANNDMVWSYEYEQYVSKSDFTAENNIYNADYVNRYLEDNPTAAGQTSEPVFKWDATYDGYMLQ